MTIPKKTPKISWLSDVVASEANSLDNKNIRFEKDKKKEEIKHGFNWLIIILVAMIITAKEKAF